MQRRNCDKAAGSAGSAGLPRTVAGMDRGPEKGNSKEPLSADMEVVQRSHLDSRVYIAPRGVGVGVGVGGVVGVVK